MFFLNHDQTTAMQCATATYKKKQRLTPAMTAANCIK